MCNISADALVSGVLQTEMKADLQTPINSVSRDPYNRVSGKLKGLKLPPQLL